MSNDKSVLSSARQSIMEFFKFEDWERFKTKREKENSENKHLLSELTPESFLAERHRQTGRTTRVIVSALVAMSRGFTVTIHAPAPARKELLLRLQYMAGDIGLRRNMVVLKDADVEFFDHQYWDRC